MAQPFAEPCDRGIIDAQPCPREEGRELPKLHRNVVLAACVLASSMVFIDGSALTVALPDLRASLGADFVAVQWVLNGYVLALASLTLVGGTLADLFGKARVLSIGCLLFGLTSAGCALAPDVEWLVGLRVLQGVAAAMLTPASLALIGETFPKAERNRAIGVWAAASAMTTAGGPVMGGWLTETFGWPSIFWINPPLALIVVVALAAYAPVTIRTKRRFDFVGAAILAASLGLLAWALSDIGSGAAGDSFHASLASGASALAAVIGLVGIAAFAWWERIAPDPMTPPRLAGNRAFVGLNVSTLLVYCGLAIMFFLIPFDLVDRRGLSPADAGLTFLPFTLAVGLLSRLFGGLADKIGSKTLLVVGPIGAALAYVWIAAGQTASLAVGIIAPMALLGLSFAVLVAPLTASVLSSVNSADEGLASGINNAASRVAQLAGIALAAGVSSFTVGFYVGLIAAAIASVFGAIVILTTIR
jgi:EmrB/QacA subfamily drug resistance transporter